MTGARAVRRLRWAAIGAGLVLAGCGSAAAPTAQLSHAGSPGISANGTQRCTEVYCLPQALTRGPAHSPTPKAFAVPSNGTQRCTEVYCLPQAVTRGRANSSAPKAPAGPSYGTQRCTEVYCLPQAVPRGQVTFTATG